MWGRGGSTMLLRNGRRPPAVAIGLSGLLLTLRPASAFAAYALGVHSLPAMRQHQHGETGLGDPTLLRAAVRRRTGTPAAADSARTAAARALEEGAGLDGAPRPRRLILTSSSSGLMATETRAVLFRMIAASRAERSAAAEGPPADGPPRILFVITAALAGSTERAAGLAEAAEAAADALTLASWASGVGGMAAIGASADEDEAPASSADGDPAAIVEEEDDDAGRGRSLGERRRRRVAAAKKKVKLLCAELGMQIGGLVDLQALVAEEEARALPPSREGGAESLARARLVRDVCAARLRETLWASDAVWIVGGNTFLLRHWMAQSGLDAVLLQLVGQAGVPFVGQSAGAIVAGVTAQVALWKGWDDPAAAPPPSGLEPPEPEGEVLAVISALTPPSIVVGTRPAAAAAWGLARLAGVGLVPCSVFPHYAPQWAALCDRLSATELRAAAATAAALGVAADISDGPQTDAAAAAEALSSLVLLRDGETFVWDESQPLVHRTVLGAAGLRAAAEAEVEPSGTLPRARG
ncbi:hypothetical protein T492DRAFT_1075084 [Pavlovales sp. CCMP2436]|nr:hypothetical protein T492DRAFT_1075084 [Pavlovales sp. CCMP2436]